jgi:hypothetical protein
VCERVCQQWWFLRETCIHHHHHHLLQRLHVVLQRLPAAAVSWRVGSSVLPVGSRRKRVEQLATRQRKRIAGGGGGGLPEEAEGCCCCFCGGGRARSMRRRMNKRRRGRGRGGDAPCRWWPGPRASWPWRRRRAKLLGASLGEGGAVILGCHLLPSVWRFPI